MLLNDPHRTLIQGTS